MRRSRGQGSAEIMMVISVVTLTVVASASTMVPLFRSGVERLGRDVAEILSSGSVGGVGSDSGSNTGEGNRGSNGNGSVNGRVGSARAEDMESAADDYSDAVDSIGRDVPQDDGPAIGQTSDLEIGPPL